MNSSRISNLGTTARRSATKLIQAAALTLAVSLAIPAHAADSREIRSRIAPVYPEMAKRMKISGPVKLSVVVDADGKVTEAKAINGNRMLGPAAEEAVKHWKFESGAGSATVEVQVTFALPE